MTLTNILSEAGTGLLIRALNSSKSYLYFDISVFNVGAAINIKCTDRYKQDGPRSWNGYNFCIENDDTTKYYIIQALKDRTLTKRQKTIYNRYV